jgi:hypothetical protein
MSARSKHTLAPGVFVLFAAVFTCCFSSPTGNAAPQIRPAAAVFAAAVNSRLESLLTSGSMDSLMMRRA